MDDDREVLARLDRIERLDGAGAPVAELLGEVRALLRAAERVARRADDGELARAVAGVHDALEANRPSTDAGGEDEHLSGWPLVTVIDRPR